MKNNCHEPSTILIVEDNPGDIRLIKEAFSDCKAPENLYHVNDAKEALKFLKKQGQYKDTPNPNIVFLDLKLPKISGAELLNTLKKNPELKAIPVIVFSSSDAEEDVKKAYNLHANCYIVKPTDFTELVKVINSIIEFWLNIVRLPKNG